MIANPSGQILIDLVSDIRSLLIADGTAMANKYKNRPVPPSGGSGRVVQRAGAGGRLGYDGRCAASSRFVHRGRLQRFVALNPIHLSILKLATAKLSGGSTSLWAGGPVNICELEFRTSQVSSTQRDCQGPPQFQDPIRGQRAQLELAHSLGDVLKVVEN
jgi:hypothetical protein